MINFILIGLFGIYILFIQINGNGLQSYLNSKYIPFVIIMSLSAVVISIIGLTINKKFRLRNFTNLLKTNKLTDAFNNIEEFIILIAFVILGKLFSPIFFLFGIFLLLTRFDLESITKKNGWKHLFIIIFLIFGFLVPSSGISSFTALQRFQPGKNVQIFSEKTIADSFGRSTSDYTIGDWVASLNFNTDSTFYIAKDVDVIGFIFKPDILPKDYFMVSRFVIRCCAADATPVGLIVKFKNWEENFEENDWIRVEGKFIEENFNNQNNLVIEPKQVFKVEKPVDIFIY